MQTELTYRTNRDLFSNYYLDEHLPETEAWDELSDDELREAKADIMDLWEREKGTAPKRNESQLEEKFIRPMFRKLGIPFEVEESTSRTQRRPDYGFFESEDAARGAFERREEGGDFYKDAVAVADAKRWGRPLDTRGSGEHERDFENPSYQIHVYLQETPAQWAVLTDGKKWRLYYGPTSHRLDSYYEIDLPTVLEKGDLEDFKYFYLFFRHGAFLEDSTGECFLDEVYDESNVFAQELGEDLQDNIYEAIKVLSEGFLQYPENNLEKETLVEDLELLDDPSNFEQERLDLVHDSSLIYLYRLIFVLYAESEGRDLLDTNNDIYEESYSLNTLKQDVAEELDSPSPKFRDWQDNLWDRLAELFKLIDRGSKSRGIPEEDLYIPAYNGGLFRTDPDKDDTPEAQFLAEYQVGDAHLAEVIELLTRSQNENGSGKIFVDYSSLDVRHLGSIYEGLLEYQLNIADEPLALDNGEYVSADSDDDIVVQEGELYLTTDSGERKATGSYYTPEYVVEHIVKNTLEPLVDDIYQDLLASDPWGQEGGGQFAKDFAERVFELKILDPAIGSGHFLKNAIDFLAREIINAQERQAEQQGVESIDQSRDINWARRQVAQRCIYGIDLNPLAVELAKVSLWLRTLAAEQPLAFLDHHLKTGNSLVGSDIEDVLSNGESTAENGQLTLQQSFAQARQQALEHVMDRFQDLLSIDNESLSDIKEMEAAFEEVRDDPLYQHLLAMANVHTAETFGLDVPGDAYERMAESLRNDSWQEIKDQDWFKRAQAIADEENFFHWELEFPVAFYNEHGERKEDSGFDAIIGNPPYTQIQLLDETEADYYREVYDTSTGNFDIYVLFVEKGVTLLNKEGKFGYILPNKFFRVDYGENLRELLSSNKQVRKIVDFGSNQVFADSATTYTTLLFLQGNEREEPFAYWQLDDDSDPATLADIDVSGNWTKTEFNNNSLDETPWNFHAEEIKQTIDSADEHSVPLGEIAFGISRGTSSGGDEVFELKVEDQDNDLLYCTSDVEDEPFPIERAVLRKPIHSTDFEKYNYHGAGEKRVIWPYNSEYNILSEDQFQRAYPNTWDYLTHHRDTLENRADYSRWYDYSAPRNLEVHDRAKILVPLLAEGPSFSPYPEPQSDYILMASGGFSISLHPDSKYSRDYILSLINSKLLYLYLESISNVFRGGYITCTKQYFQQLPVREITFTTPENERAEMVATLESKYEDYIEQEEGADSSAILGAVETHLDRNEEDVIHDVLAELAREVIDLKTQYNELNLSLLDYLGNYAEGPNLPDIGLFQPSSSNILDATSEEYENLRVNNVRTNRNGQTVTISATARYKPEEEDKYETDQWGYTETEYHEAFKLTNLSNIEASLVETFVPLAVEKADGFADFRETATKTNSLIDRLKAITLPNPDDVSEDLRRYIQVKKRAEDLDKRIKRTDELIDEIVYDLYGLTGDEIEIVESAVQND